MRRLGAQADFYKDLLIWRHRRSREDGSMFGNDRKLSLINTIAPGQKEAVVFESCYYLSYLTNDLSTLDVEDGEDKGRPRKVWAGIDHFPVEKGHGAELIRMKSLEATGLSNHMGGNTLAFTNDRRLVITRQSRGSLRSVRLLAPSGSGSLDYNDFKKGTRDTLGRVVTTGMEREFLEENHAQGAAFHGWTLATRIIGFYRWVGKGGLPGFLGVTRVGADSSELEPNTSEVDNPEDLQTSYPAESIEDLRLSIAELMRSPLLSVPLFANLTVLREVADTEPEYLNFLFDSEPLPHRVSGEKAPSR